MIPPRLEQVGWLERCPMVRGEGCLFFASRGGIRFLGLSVAAASTPAPTWWAHHSAAPGSPRGTRSTGARSSVRASSHQVVWRPGVGWDRQHVRQSRHRPDLVGAGPAGTVASEVELAPKSQPRLDAILRLPPSLAARRPKRASRLRLRRRAGRAPHQGRRSTLGADIESKALQVVLLDTTKAHAERASSKDLATPSSCNRRTRLALERVALGMTSPCRSVSGWLDAVGARAQRCAWCGAGPRATSRCGRAGCR